LSWKQVFEERVALLKVAAFDPKAKPLHALLGAAVGKALWNHTTPRVFESRARFGVYSVFYLSLSSLLANSLDSNIKSKDPPFPRDVTTTPSIALSGQSRVRDD